MARYGTTLFDGELTEDLSFSTAWSNFGPFAFHRHTKNIPAVGEVDVLVTSGGTWSDLHLQCGRETGIEGTRTVAVALAKDSPCPNVNIVFLLGQLDAVVFPALRLIPCDLYQLPSMFRSRIEINMSPSSWRCRQPRREEGQ